jgi:uncharacterized protein YkwD
MKLILLILVLVGLINAPQIQDTQVIPNTQAGELFILTNQERITALLWDNCLAQQAELRAKDLVERKYFSHDAPEGGKPFDTMIPLCGEWQHIGENIAKDFKTTELMHQGLMNSPTHKKNIQGNYTQGGFGCYENICVQFFKS